MSKAVIRVLAISAGVAAVLLVSSCALSVSSPSAAQMSGTWVHKSADVNAVITLNPNMTFKFVDVPEGVLVGEESASGGLPRGHLLSMSGTWSIGKNDDANGLPYIELKPPINRYFIGGVSLELLGSGDSATLSIPLGDPDDAVSYDFSH